MIKRIIVVAILTGILIGIPFLFFENYTQSIERKKELDYEFEKIESEEIKRVHLIIRNNLDSLLLDSVIVDSIFCRKLREIFLKLRENSDPIPRLIYGKTFYLDVTTATEKHIYVKVYNTYNTALILVKTKSKDSFGSLEDFFSSVNLKELLESV